MNLFQSVLMPSQVCSHLAAAKVLISDETVCPECVAIGSGWVHLRLCLSCGHVGCCDSSPNKHASAHARSGGHPTVRSLQPGETWAYCYADDLLVDDL
ncbi:MAG: UBP-type zinc finger domain-containing protein [Actinomycetota bacterium]|nr:UBP-type zinc finger domain-containing protein [Actinomycetota bacterium]